MPNFLTSSASSICFSSFFPASARQKKDCCAVSTQNWIQLVARVWFLDLSERSTKQNEQIDFTQSRKSDCGSEQPGHPSHAFLIYEQNTAIFSRLNVCRKVARADPWGTPILWTLKQRERNVAFLLLTISVVKVTQRAGKPEASKCKSVHPEAAFDLSRSAIRITTDWSK